MKRSEIEKLGKIAFVFSGGSMRGGAAAGMAQVLWEEGIRPSHILGISAGALTGAGVCAGKIDELIYTWENLRRKELYSSRFLAALLKGIVFSDHILNNSAMLDLFMRFVSEKPEGKLSQEEKEKLVGEALIASDITLNIVTSSLQSGTRTFSNRDKAIIENPEILAKVMIASASIPISFKPVELDGEQYVDGDIFHSNPFIPALEDDCDTIFYFYTPEYPDPKQQYTNLFEIINRIISMNSHHSNEVDILFDEAIGATNPFSIRSSIGLVLSRMRRVFRGYKSPDARLITIMPDGPLGEEKLKMFGEFDKEKLRSTVEKGRQLAKEALAREGLL